VDQCSSESISGLGRMGGGRRREGRLREGLGITGGPVDFDSDFDFDEDGERKFLDTHFFV